MHSFLSDLCGREVAGVCTNLIFIFLSDLCGREGYIKYTG
ncbi:hypothetical protein EJK50_0028 [Moraxella catarrhalis]|nr:hypothetical protein EJK50_0028 [Moraxella catarrhalis]